MIFKQPARYLALISLHLILLSSVRVTQAQEKLSLVRGIVNNATNEPVADVSVLIRNTKTNFTSGTTTDSAGNFEFSRIPVGGPYSFTFSVIGYDEQILSGYNIKEDAQLSLVVILKSNAESLNQVVVVGYGTQRRKDLTGSVSSVGASQIKDLNVTRIDQALVGKVAGVQVKPSSGEPGAPPLIRVRGVGSISAGGDPLYVIDGFPSQSIDMLNPNDIESLDILKDASATAIYGSRGANGVIIINTKRGKSGDPKITVDAYTGWQQVARVPHMMNARESAQYSYDGIRNANIDAGNNVSGPASTWIIKVPQVSLDVLEGRNNYDFNALDDVLRTAPQRSFTLGISGGSEKLRYSLSGEYLDQDGIVLNNNFKRYSFRANFDIQATKRLSIKVNLNPSVTNAAAVTAAGGDDGVNSEGIIGQALYIHNFYPLYVNENGAPVSDNGQYFVFSGLEAQGAIVNPLALANEIKTNRKRGFIIGSVNAEYKIMDELRLNVLAGANLLYGRASKFKPSQPAFFDQLPQGRDESSTNFNWLTEYTLNYNKTWGDHSLSGVGGFTVQKDLLESSYLTSDKFPNNLVPTLSAVSGVISNGSSEKSEWSMVSYLARGNYNYKGRYYLSASIRTDGSSRFGPQRKWGVFPSAAVAWRISDEDFVKNLNFFENLKLRASYGETGNNNIGNYEHQGTISYLLYPLNNIPTGGYAPQRISNPLLTWETQIQMNIGIDMSFLNRRVNLTIDNFQSTNKDLLLNVTIPSVTGFTNTLKNIGEVKNKGWEFTLNTVNIKRNFEWSTDLNFSTFKNEVVKLGPKGDPIYAGGSVTMIGQPIGMFYGWLTDGVFLNQAEVDKGPVFHPGAADRSRPGDVRFRDISGPDGKPDGIIDGLDKTTMGSPHPDFYYGMTNNFAYKNITFSVSLQGSQGNDVMALTRGTIANSRARYRQLALLNNYWKSETDIGDGKTPRPNNAPSGNFRGTYSQLWLDDGSYLRINNITLGYRLPEKMLRNFKVTGLRVYVSANNPFIITKYHGFNPDVNNNTNSLTPGVDLNDYPLSKSLMLGLNLSF